MLRRLHACVVPFCVVALVSCGNTVIKTDGRTEVHSADALDDDEDVIAEKPAVISGSHLFCSESPEVVGEAHVNVVCSA